MKTYKEYKENLMGNPVSDIEKYIIGLKNRLLLLRPEEIEQYRQQLLTLKQVLDRLL